MIIRNISCTYCGQRGIIGYPGISDIMPTAEIFRHLGHNPWSGNLHYQCPSCRIVLLVDPMDVLDGKGTINGSIGQFLKAGHGMCVFLDILNEIAGRLFPSFENKFQRRRINA